MRRIRKVVISGTIGLAFFLSLGIYSGKIEGELLPRQSEVEVEKAVIPEISPLSLMKKPIAYIEEKEPEELMTKKVAVLTSEDISSPYAILIRLKNKEILFEKNSETTIYPASLTKIMTAIVAIEHMPDFNKKIILKKEAFEGLREAGASMAGFIPGEEIRGIDLLYGLLLPSGAECGKALAYEVSGSIDAFVDLMNEKAEELGMTQTHFMNTTGLHQSNHYTTIKDLSILLQYALENDIFRQIYTSPYYAIPADNKHTEGLALTSTLFKHEDLIGIKEGEIIGGKTGYTSAAGLCLSSLARIGDEEYIFITAGADGNHYTEPLNIEDAVKAYGSIVSEEAIEK